MLGLKRYTRIGAIFTTAVALGVAACSQATTPKIEELIALQDALIEKAESTRGGGTPPVWTLSDDDTTIHIFGTFHLLPPDLEWRSPEFEAAFAAADKVVLEADVTSEEGQRAFSAALPKYTAYSDGQKLNDVLDDEEEAIVRAGLAEAGLAIDALQTVKPWFITLQVTGLQIMKSGYQLNAGVEQVLIAEASESGKALGYLETAADQLAILGGADVDDQVDGLVMAVQMIDEGLRGLNTLVAEWGDGDIAGLGALAASPEALGDQELYEAILVNRNRNWVPQIKAMLDEPGTVMVAVGAGHLAGPDSVITMLRADGLEISGPQ